MSWVLVSTAQGLSPFAMVDLMEEDVVEMQQDSQDLENATVVSVLDHKVARAKLVAKTQQDAETFMMMLKQYTNLLFVL